VSPIFDRHRRPLANLRVSVTDRCNLRCDYCMPERDYVWLPRESVLSFEEIDVLAGIFTRFGVERVRLTGGEPLLRRDLDSLVRLLVRRAELREVTLTTNGLLLAEQAAALRAAGLARVTVSLDTLRPERFRTLTRRDGLERAVAGIEAAQAAGFQGTKIDSVLLRGVNDDEIVDLLEFGKRQGAEVRFIEYMDVGGATRWSMRQVVPRVEILGALSRRYGPIQPLAEESTAPAQRFALPDGTIFGIIASTTAPFCSACDRSRLTADGIWYLCLYATAGVDLRALLRGGVPQAEIAECIARTWGERRDRGAEERLVLHARTAFVSADGLRADPHLEMHTRGG
jgi:cyclic pyranopterin phosphate synthase